MSEYQDILVSRDQRVLLLTLNRPEARNALRDQTLAELAAALDEAREDDGIRCAVVYGDLKVFAAGADLNEMSERDMIGMLDDPRPGYWSRIAAFPKPLIAAVNGFALGAGCELALSADIVIAGDNAQFGQPEINLGIMPGAGGTQRLIRAVGKSLASKMVLTGEFVDAPTALAAGLVSDVVVPELTLEKAQQLARVIASKSPLALRQAKEALRQAFEGPLSSGLEFERKAFVMLAGSEDRREGIDAFLQKRKPEFKGR
ncbi:MAG: 2,3-dehydroadipyl-CoA hydratase [Gammaproteobacteria bacterium]|nr:MAG: 2,3-dehydroadipyl-CoA hydratase [Gammaproteobacteria bacterium]